MLIDGYEIDLYCPACDPGSEAWVATVNTVAELSELMPYVNAVVEKGEYIPGCLLYTSPAADDLLCVDLGGRRIIKKKKKKKIKKKKNQNKTKKDKINKKKI